MKCLVVVSGSEQTEEDRRLTGLAAWMGVPTKSVVIRHGGSIGQRLLDELKPIPCALAMSASTLVTLQSAFDHSEDAQKFLSGACGELLVFHCGPSTEESAAISRLGCGEVSGVVQMGGPEITISFPEDAKDYSRQLAGLRYVRRSDEAISAFALREKAAGHAVIAAANDRPIFVRIAAGTLQVFLLGGPSLADLDERLSRGHELKEHYERLLPAIMFLRHCFGEHCWHGDRPTARLIIDDPLLTQRYGFLDFRTLLNSMQRNNYGTSIAFVPWNCWRTSKRNVERLLDNSHLSLCIHGCDHANKEFEAQDPAVVGRKAALALQRMDSMKVRTGAGFEPVMVFPQERYSKAAIAALRGQQYLAAVNTIRFPIDGEPGDLRIRDFLAPAITRYQGFPVFQRRYPRRLFDFACDLFLGKPALIVEHHDYFRNGVTALEDFVGALYRIEPNLRWPDLRSQLAESCQLRRVADGSTEVRYFTRQFRLTPRDGGTDRYLLSKHEPDANRIEAALVDGKPTQFAFDGELLRLEVQAEPGQVREIEIVDRQDGHQPARAFGIRHNARVLVRRALSEFRDNTLSGHNSLQRAAQWVADKLNVTGEGYDDLERYETRKEDCSEWITKPNLGADRSNCGGGSESHARSSKRES